MGSVVALDGSLRVPEFLQKLLDEADQIESLAVVVNWDNGSTAVYHTTMTNRDIAWLRWVFDQELRP